VPRDVMARRGARSDAAFQRHGAPCGGGVRLLSALALAALLAGCSLRHAALEQMAGALAEGGAAFASDDDPELVRAAAPVTLKLIEAMLEQRPADARLHLAAASG